MYEIWNFGPTTKFPGPTGNIEILRGTGFETDNKELAEYMERFPKISVKSLKNLNVQSEESEDDAEKWPKTMGALRRLAKKRGIRTWVGIKKTQVIGLLERGV